MMDALRRVVRRSPHHAFNKNNSKSKAEKIPEGWGENKEPVADGVTFFLKYIGSTLVEEVNSNDSYGDGISAKAIINIIAMAKSAGKKLRKTALTVASKGITMKDITTGQLMFDLSIYRISFCTADKTYDKVFAYIARNTTNETMECHAFLCAKTKIAQAVTLTVSKAFSVAQDKFLEHKKSKRLSKERFNKEKNGAKPESNGCNNSPVINGSHQFPVWIQGPAEYFSSNVSADNSPSKRSQDSDSKKGWESFEDSSNSNSDNDNIDDLFSQLAEDRIKTPPSLGTDLWADELDDSVQQYMSGDACYEAFSRTKSLEDLLDL